MTNKHFCILPFTHLNLKPNGRVSACWRNQDFLGNYNDTPIKDIWEHGFKNIRNKMNADIPNKWCRSCWDAEAAGSKSTRQVSNDESLERYNHLITKPTIKTVELRFSNVCSLHCLHCSPVYSSTWNKLAKTDENLQEFQQLSESYSLSDTVLAQIIELAPELDLIQISGGEPLTSAKHYRFLEAILPYANKIMLNYNSNLQTLTFGTHDVIDLWKHFRKVILHVSIDGTETNYSYLRRGGNLRDVEKNIRRIQKELTNCKLRTTFTASLLNITKLKETIEYYDTLGTLWHSSLVQWPEHLNIKVLPKELKEQINDKLASIDFTLNAISQDHIDSKIKYTKNLISYMNAEDLYNEYWNKFKRYINLIDSKEQTNILEVFPEFKQYW